MGRYYSAEHEAAYQRIEDEGLTQWSDLFEESTGSFPNHEFLEKTLPTLKVPHGADVLEYGCGTGIVACHLAELGYRVTAVDLVPRAIKLARQNALDRGLQVDFAVQDICAWPADSETTYDVIIDSFCLQSIVLDEDRSRLFAGVRARLRPTGYYLISTAMFDPDRDYGDDQFDPATGICSVRTADGSLLPHRRHLRAEALRAELERAGFPVLAQEGGDVVCAA
ncbi:MAG TPA: methyltransferase domain-containing protein [Mycobacteriales bacterium]|nr:methyltransferase domain-containing protein [Mycobacteriales bacterium]